MPLARVTKLTVAKRERTETQTLIHNRRRVTTRNVKVDLS